MSIQATIHKLKYNLSKHTSIYAAVALMLLSVLLPLTPTLTLAEQVNLIANPSVELADGTGAAAASWTKGGWGTNTSTYSWQNTGSKDGTRSHKINVTSYTNGDAKWMSAPITVKPNTQYQLSDWYISNVQTSVELAYTSTTGAISYGWLANTAASTSWKQSTTTFTTPANVKQVSIYHVINKVGSLQTDAYNLTDLSDPGTTPTPVPPTVSISAPTNGATVSGTQTITANASDTTGISGVQFKVDGANFGAEDTTAPYTTSLDTKTLANGNHTISAIARNPGGLTSTATSTVTVNNTTTTPPTNPNPTNLIVNPGVETASGTAPANWWNNSWGSLTAAFAYQSTGAHAGSRSLKTTVSNYKSGDAKWSFANVAVTPGKTYKYSAWYKSTVDSEIDAAVTMNDGTVQYYYLTTVSTSSAWKQAVAQFTAPVNAKEITIYHALAKNGNVTTDDFSLTEYTPQGFGQAMVSLTFDDGWRSQYDHAMPILEKYNMPATFYVLTETVSYPDYMTVAQMQTLKNKGHELDSHTVSHANLPTLTLTQLRNELSKSQSQLRTWYGNTVADDFASPYGAYNATTVNEIKKYYRSHRSTDEGFNSKDSFDIYNIKVQNILYSTPAAQVDAWIKQAQREQTWLVLVYHEVATAVEDPTYSISPADLDAQLAALQQSGVAVKTVGQALDYIKSQN